MASCPAASTAFPPVNKVGAAHSHILTPTLQALAVRWMRPPLLSMADQGQVPAPLFALYLSHDPRAPGRGGELALGGWNPARMAGAINWCVAVETHACYIRLSCSQRAAAALLYQAATRCYPRSGTSRQTPGCLWCPPRPARAGRASGAWHWTPSNWRAAAAQAAALQAAAAVQAAAVQAAVAQAAVQAAGRPRSCCAVAATAAAAVSARLTAALAW